MIADDGGILASVLDEVGMLSVPHGGWDAALAQLKGALGAAERGLVLIAGMAGADRGWRDAGYLPCPADIDDLARAICWVEPGQVAIVPGLSIALHPVDVMRGEETQLLGAIAAGLAPADCFACHPGTHTKWISARGGKVAGFRTAMTGEMFALLKNHSILSGQLREDVTPGPDFDAGLERGLATGEAIADLFAVRADALSGAGRIGNGAAYASGLLIGADVRAGLAMSAEREVRVIGRPDLAALYARAIEASGRSAVPVDGGTAVVAGLRRIAEIVA